MLDATQTVFPSTRTNSCLVQRTQKIDFVFEAQGGREIIALGQKNLRSSDVLLPLVFPERYTVTAQVCSQHPILMDSKCQGSIEDDDIFWDDESHQDNLNTNPVLDLDREWQARYKQFHTVGYREGLLAGKEKSAQLGFNNGFKESVLAGYNFGKVRGITSLFAILPEHVKGKLIETSEGRTKLEALHGKVSSMSGKDALKLFHEDVLKGGVEARSKSKENSQVDLEENLQKLNTKEHIGSSANTRITGELADLHRQLVSMLENTSLKAAC